MEAFVRIHSSLRKTEDRAVDKVRAMLSRPDRRYSDTKRVEAMQVADRKALLMPRPTPYYLLKELLGWNSINDKFLYVTDGGHYENLGLVELLRRGCTRIYCFDASRGEPLGELGDAIALARSELGVEITFENEALDRLDEHNDAKVAADSCAIGTIRYTRSTPEVLGVIAYCPTVMTAALPWDVRAYQRKDDAFPHHTTFDQLFTDQKFEAYRVLGYHSAARAMEALDELPGTAIAQLAPVAPEDAPNGDAKTRAGRFRRAVGRLR